MHNAGGRAGRRRVVEVVGASLAAIAAASLAVAVLEGPAVRVADASPVYLIAVVLVASRYGLRASVATSLAASVTYDFLFTSPRFTFVMADPRDWLELLVFLFIALVVSRLAAVSLGRAELAERRVGEAEAQFSISRALATEDPTAAAPEILARLTTGTGLERAWITVEDGSPGRVLADSLPGTPPPSGPIVEGLAREGEGSYRWVRAHAGTRPERRQSGERILRVRIEADGRPIGLLWATTRAATTPSAEATRLLALAADQLGAALHRERLRRESIEAEVARRSDLAKSALLSSVSHDLRTPLAGIRAAADSILDPDAPHEPAAANEAALEIRIAVERLDRLVRGLLDLGRIESGDLRPDLEPFELASLVEPAVDRGRPTLGERPIRLELPEDLPLVRVDELLFAEVIANLLENVARHAPAPAALAIRAERSGARVLLTVADGGQGVPEAELRSLVSRFRAPTGPRPDARPGGRGIGLAVVDGFARAMGIEVTVARSDLGGLAVMLAIPTVDLPSHEVAA